MKKVLIYLRVSDIMQEEKDSLNKQEEQVIKYCSFKNYKIYKIIKEVGSGRKNDRTGFVELEKEVKENKFDILVFYELSRLARNTFIIHKLINSLREKEIAFESVTEPHLNSDAPMSSVMLGFMAGLNEFESDMNSKRVKNRMRHYVSEGYHPFPAPLGFRVEGNILYPVPEEVEKVVSIFQDFINGYSLTKLSQKYNISLPGIKRLLTNVAYIGKVKFGFEGRNLQTGKRETGKVGEIFPGKHESIVDEETFNLAQKILEGITSNRLKNNYSDYLLTGLLKHCIGTNNRMVGKKTPRKKTEFYRSYRCTCCDKTISADLLEKEVINHLKEYVKMIEIGGSKKKKKSADPMKEVNKLLAKRTRIIESYQDGFIEREKYLSQVKVIDTEIETCRNKMKNEENLEKQESNKEILLHIMQEFDKKDIVEKKMILKLMIEEVVVIDKENIEITFNL